MARAELQRAVWLVGAIGVAAVAVWLDAHAAAKGRLPTSHPWAELALLAAAINLGLHAMRPAEVPAESPRYLVAGALLAASVLGLMASRGL